MGGPPNRRRRRPLPLHPPPSPPLEDAAGLSPCVDGGGEASSPRGGAGRGSALVQRLGSYRTAAVLVVVVAYGGGEGVTEMRGHGAASGGGGRGCAGPIWAREGLWLVRPVHRLMAAWRPDLARLAFGGVLLRAALWCVVVVVVVVAVRCWMAARRRLRRNGRVGAQRRGRRGRARSRVGAPVVGGMAGLRHRFRHHVHGSRRGSICTRRRPASSTATSSPTTAPSSSPALLA